MIVPEATTATGAKLAMKVALNPTTEDLRRLAGLCAEPGMAGAEWTGKEGREVR